jgi:hypothetical protein
MAPQQQPQKPKLDFFHAHEKAPGESGTGRRELQPFFEDEAPSGPERGGAAEDLTTAHPEEDVSEMVETYQGRVDEDETLADLIKTHPHRRK